MSIRSPLRRKILLGALLSAAALLSSFTLAAPAHASPTADVVCAGTEAGTFTPGLTLAPRDVAVTINSQLIGCDSTTEPTISAGSINYTYQARDLSCLSFGNAGSATLTIVWNDGRTSTFSFNNVVSAVNGNTVATQTGTITAGLFAGRSAVRVITSPNVQLVACVSPQGLTTKYGTATLTIFSL